jgi:hypothetical protein
MNSTPTDVTAPAYNRSRQAREAETLLDRIEDDFPDNPQAMQ